MSVNARMHIGVSDFFFFLFSIIPQTKVVVAKETVGNLGGMIRQLSLDQFENESRRMHPSSAESSAPSKKHLNRQKSPQGLHKKVISLLLRPRNWKPPANRAFFLDSYEVGELCYAAEQIFMQEPTVLQLKAPIKVFGDLHGQFGDLMRLFDEYGFPSTAGDITLVDIVSLSFQLFKNSQFYLVFSDEAACFFQVH